MKKFCSPYWFSSGLASVPVSEKRLKNHQIVIVKDRGQERMFKKPQETATHYTNFVNSIKK